MKKVPTHVNSALVCIISISLELMAEQTRKGFFKSHLHSINLRKYLGIVTAE